MVSHGLVLHSIAARHVELPPEVPRPGPDGPPLRFGNTALSILSGPAPWRSVLFDCTAHLESELADDALYWLGVLDYEAGACEESLSHLGVLLSRFPASERAPAAHLKSALCLDRLGEESAAARMRAQLLEKIPRSDEAALVRAETEGR